MSQTPPDPERPEGQRYHPYGQQQPGYQGPYAVAPSHHESTTVLVLGILSLVLCQILGPVAWVMGNRVVGQIDASQGQLGGRDTANIGRILGIIATALLALAVVGLVFFVVILAGIAATAP
jgi:uncharacterized membrane protein YjgN (DUF898 family)